MIILGRTFGNGCLNLGTASPIMSGQKGKFKISMEADGKILILIRGRLTTMLLSIRGDKRSSFHRLKRFSQSGHNLLQACWTDQHKKPVADIDAPALLLNW